MANNPTPPAIPLGSDWTDLYVASGLTVGDPLLVTCRAAGSVFLVESATQPADTLEGIEVRPTDQHIIDRGSVGLWGRAAVGKTTRAIVQLDPKG